MDKKNNIFEEALDKLKRSLDELEKKLKINKLIDNDSINKFCDNFKPYKLQINYNKASFDDKNKENQEDKYFPIRGGCYPKINNNIYLNENEEIEQKLYQKFINNKIMNIKKNKKKYFIIKTELRNGFFYGSLLNYFSNSIDINKIILLIGATQTNQVNINSIKNIKDISGNSLGHYKILTYSNLNKDESNINITREMINQENYTGIKPELFAIAKEDISLCKKLLSLPYSDFSFKTEGSLTPLSLAIINRLRNIVDILLSDKYIYKNGNLNISNELGLTPLHLSVICNLDKAFEILINKGGNISLTDRKGENTPIHLIGIYARNEITLSIYKNKNFVNFINKQRPDGKTALHFMCSNSILGTKLFLEAGADCNIVDTSNNTPAKFAFFTGRFDCYELILEKAKNKKELELKNNIKQIIYNSNDIVINNDNSNGYKDLLQIYLKIMIITTQKF